MIWSVLLLVAAGYVWWRRSRPLLPDLPDELEPLSSASTSATVIAEVKCITVTPERQEWRSLKTGRRYDVLSANGMAGASEGDRGLAIKEGSGWRIIAENELKADSPDGTRPQK